MGIDDEIKNKYPTYHDCFYYPKEESKRVIGTAFLIITAPIVIIGLVLSCIGLGFSIIGDFLLKIWGID